MTDMSNAARMRDIIRRIAIEEASRITPTTHRGVVTSINTSTNSCTVLLAGATTGVTVYYQSLRPSKVGQLVTVSGRSGSYYLTDVAGPAYQTPLDPEDLTTPTWEGAVPSADGINVFWSGVSFPEFKIEYSTESDFSANVAEKISTNKTSDIIAPLTKNTDYYIRVSSGNGAGLFGDPTSINGPYRSLNILSNDGNAPSMSPDPIVRGGIRTVFASWEAVANNDPVTYKIYVATTNGFTPNSTNFFGETSSTFASIDRLPNGDQLPTDGSPTYVRLVASDVDGDAPPGAQGSAEATLVNLGDVGNVPGKKITDGKAPSVTSPTPTITPGPGFLYCTWSHILNDDQLTYELHISTQSGFIPATNTLVDETPATYAFIKNQSPADGGGDLDYTATYYVRIRARDNDGYAPYGQQVVANVRKVETEDLEPFAVTNAIIANLAVDTAKIVDLSVTTAKIADLAVDSAKINDLSVITAKINDLAVTFS